MRAASRHDVLDVERLELVHALQPDVLLRDRELELLAEDLRVEEILDADPDSGRLIRVRRADPTPASCRSGVVPSFRSRAPSSATCHGITRCAFPETNNSPSVA